jgi:hypothetical protein
MYPNVVSGSRNQSFYFWCSIKPCTPWYARGPKSVTRIRTSIVPKRELLAHRQIVTRASSFLTALSLHSGPRDFYSSARWTMVRHEMGIRWLSFLTTSKSPAVTVTPQKQSRQPSLDISDPFSQSTVALLATTSRIGPTKKKWWQKDEIERKPDAEVRLEAEFHEWFWVVLVREILPVAAIIT